MCVCVCVCVSGSSNHLHRECVCVCVCLGHPTTYTESVPTLSQQGWGRFSSIQFYSPLTIDIASEVKSNGSIEFLSKLNKSLWRLQCCHLALNKLNVWWSGPQWKLVWHSCPRASAKWRWQGKTLFKQEEALSRTQLRGGPICLRPAL